MAFGALSRLLGRRPARQLAIAEAYDIWAETYPPWAHNPLMEAEQGVVEPIVRAARARRALDVGTGTGRGLAILNEARIRLVIGVDLSQAMLQRNAFAGARVCGDACRLPFACGAFDLISSSLMVGDIEDPRPWLEEAARLLAPGGTLVYSDFHPSWVEHGWTRTFRAPSGERLELPFYPHTIEQHLALLEELSLEVRAIREPRAPTAAAPVVAVFHAVKPR